MSCLQTLKNIPKGENPPPQSPNTKIISRPQEDLGNDRLTHGVPANGRSHFSYKNAYFSNCDVPVEYKCKNMG